jgi:hypothetical protein
MKSRGVILLVAGAGASALGTALAFGGVAGVDRACPAMGWAFVGDVELSFSTPPESVSACFGEGCTPVPVGTNAEGK